MEGVGYGRKCFGWNMLLKVFSPACDTPGQCMTSVKSDELQI